MKKEEPPPSGGGFFLSVGHHATKSALQVAPPSPITRASNPMYLHLPGKSRIGNRSKNRRRKAKGEAKNRRRVNRMHKRKLGRRLKRNG